MAAPSKLILEPGRAAKNYWRDLFHYRELFLILAWRDVTVRYKQTAAGAAWALIQPLMSIIIMTVIFGQVARVALGQRRSLLHSGLRRHAALAILCQRAFAGQPKRGQQRQSDLQNLLSPHDCARQLHCRLAH